MYAGRGRIFPRGLTIVKRMRKLRLTMCRESSSSSSRAKERALWFEEDT